MEEFLYMPFLLLIFLGEIIFFHHISTSKLNNPSWLFKTQLLIAVLFILFMVLSVFTGKIIFATTLLPIIAISGLNCFYIYNK